MSSPAVLELVPPALREIRRPDWLTRDPWLVLDHWPEDETEEDLAARLRRRPVVTAHDAVGITAWSVLTGDEIPEARSAWWRQEQVYRLSPHLSRQLLTPDSDHEYWLEWCRERIPDYLAQIILQSPTPPDAVILLGPVLCLLPSELPRLKSELTLGQRCFLNRVHRAVLEQAISQHAEPAE